MRADAQVWCDRSEPPGHHADLPELQDCGGSTARPEPSGRIRVPRSEGRRQLRHRRPTRQSNLSGQSCRPDRMTYRASMEVMPMR